MTRFRHLAIAALALMACTVSAFAHIPRDVLNPTLSLSPLRVNSSSFVVLSSDASRLNRIQYHNGTSNFVDRVYTLDAYGNTAAMEINAGALPTVSPTVKRLTQNAADELTAIQTKTNPGVQSWTEKSPSHDDEGNLTSDGDSTFAYDFENRLMSVSSASLQETFFYAGDGTRMVSQVIQGGSTNITIFVIDHADPLRRPLAELDENGALIRRFVWARGVVAQIEANGTVHYFHHDGQGSTLALTDSGAATTDQWFYSPYGEVMTRTGTTATPYQWCGGVGVRRVSVGGLYFARHRYYHTGLHRWIARDPAGIAGGANLYAYANLNPLFFIDPYGWCAEGGGFWGYYGNALNNTADAIGMQFGAVVYDASTIRYSPSSGWNMNVSHGIYNAADSLWYSTATPAAPEATPYVAGALGVSAAASITAATIMGVEGVAALLEPDNPALPDDYWQQDAPSQGNPNTPRYDHYKYNPDAGQLEHSTVEQDAAGRQIGRTDWTDHGYPDNHTDPHHHTTEWGPGYDPQHGRHNGPFDGPYPGH